MSMPLSLIARARERKVVVPVPARFAWTPNVTVYRDGAGNYTTSYDPTQFLIEGAPGVTTYYVDAATGSDSNPGTSASPKKSITTPTGGRVTKLLIKARGTFYIGNGGSVQLGHDNFCLVAWGGAALIITTETNPATYPFVWTSQGGGVWSAPPPTTAQNGVAVYSGTDPESLIMYPLAASLSACQATPGSYFRDTSSGIVLYVHTLTGASPATGHTIYGANGKAISYAANSWAYPQRMAFYGCDLRGGSSVIGPTGDSTYSKSMEFIGCLIRWGSTTGAVGAFGSTAIIQYGNIIGPSVFDGSGYHAAPNVNCPNAIEINCIGRNNGIVSAANQGSTTHDTGKVLRVNCQYYNNSDDQIADVSANTQSWNLGCTLGPGRTTGRAGVHCGNDASNTIMYLDGCKFSTPAGQYDIMCQQPVATIAYRNMPVPHADPSGTGYIVTY